MPDPRKTVFSLSKFCMDYKYRYRYRGILQYRYRIPYRLFIFSHTKRVLAQHQLIVGLGLGLGLALGTSGLVNIPAHHCHQTFGTAVLTISMEAPRSFPLLTLTRAFRCFLVVNCIQVNLNPIWHIQHNSEKCAT
jgi:hypothetical protein